MRRTATAILLTLCFGVSAPAQEAQLLTSTEIDRIDRSPARALTLDEALRLAQKNNRDLLAARTRLRAARADVDRSIAALLPRLNFQGRFTVNHPEVALNPAQLGGASGTFAQFLQQGAMGDLFRATMPAPGNLTTSLINYCRQLTPENEHYKDLIGDEMKGICAQIRSGTANQDRAYTPEQLTNLLAGRSADGSQPKDQFFLVPRTQLDATIALTLPLLAPPAYAALSGAQRAYAAQEKQLEATEAQLLQSVASAFYAAAGADELVAARRHAIDVSQRTVQNARARLEAGVVNRVEVTRAELALIQAQQRLLEAEDSRAAAYRVLATLILLRDPFRVSAAKEGEVEQKSDGDLVQEALARRPELQALEYQARAAEAQALSGGLRWLPSLSAFGNIRLTNATGFAGRADSYAAGLQLDWLLFDGLERDAARKAASAQAQESRLKLRQLRDTVADEVQNARRQVLTRREGLKAAQRSVQLARETLELVRIQHEAGTATQLDLLTAQDQLVLAEVGLAQARFDLQLGDLSLRRLLGRPLAGP